jgi:hypothetical protein
MAVAVQTDYNVLKKHYLLVINAVLSIFDNPGNITFINKLLLSD